MEQAPNTRSGGPSQGRLCWAPRTGLGGTATLATAVSAHPLSSEWKGWRKGPPRSLPGRLCSEVSSFAAVEPLPRKGCRKEPNPEHFCSEAPLQEACRGWDRLFFRVSHSSAGREKLLGWAEGATCRTERRKVPGGLHALYLYNFRTVSATEYRRNVSSAILLCWVTSSMNECFMSHFGQLASAWGRQSINSWK